jgi:hypothetical protein
LLFISKYVYHTALGASKFCHQRRQHNRYLHGASIPFPVGESRIPVRSIFGSTDPTARHSEREAKAFVNDHERIILGGVVISRIGSGSAKSTICFWVAWRRTYPEQLTTFRGTLSLSAGEWIVSTDACEPLLLDAGSSYVSSASSTHGPKRLTRHVCWMSARWG